MSKGDDRWLTRLRALLGTGVLVWELGLDHLHHWPVFILIVWLLGGPVDKLVTLLTSGRFQLVIHDSEREQKQIDRAESETKREEEP